MVLKSDIVKKINDLVSKRPMTIQEIAVAIKKSWHTADSYVEKIAKESGTINVITFRQGTKGALKVAYLTTNEHVHQSTLQENFLKRIEINSNKKDFDFFDIYAVVDPKYKKSVIAADSSPSNKDFFNFLRKAENDIYCFSGNLSWINLVDGNKKIKDLVEEILLKRKINIKVLCRVDIASLSNIAIADTINKKLGREAIEIRHCRLPLRGFIIDGKLARFKDVKSTKDFKDKELDKDLSIYYEIYDSEWTNWLQNVFWHLYRNSMPAENKIQELERIKLAAR